MSLALIAQFYNDNIDNGAASDGGSDFESDTEGSDVTVTRREIQSEWTYETGEGGYEKLTALDSRQHVKNCAHGRIPGRTKCTSCTCKVCGKVFVGELPLSIHVSPRELGKSMHSHTNFRPFQCPSCPLRFTQKQHAIRHLRRLHRENATAPEINSIRDMENSQRTPQHLAELLNLLRPCKLQLDRCDPLLPTYLNSTDIGDKEGIWKKQKSLSCRFCWKSFPNKCALTKHEKIHSGQAHHTCPKCGKSFGRKDHLSRHIKSVHDSGRKLFSCRECNMRCGYSQNLRRHMAKFHST